MPDLADFSLQEIVTALLEQAAEQGMTPPFIILAVSPNGSATIMRVRGDGTPADLLAEHYEPEGFRVPLTLALIDQKRSPPRA
jgi:hypothetical protein